MIIFEKIKEEIMADTMNVSYTNRGIAPFIQGVCRCSYCNSWASTGTQSRRNSGCSGNDPKW